MAEARNLVVGIDLGTTNSLVAYMENDAPVVIPGEDGERLVPSVVAWTDNGVAVGNAARATLMADSASAVYSAKRLMGRDLADVAEELKLFPFRLAEGVKPGEMLRLNVGGLTLTPPEISAYVLQQLKKNAERFFGAPVSKAVITVPAYFNDAQRQATKDAGRIAGLEVLRLVNEPTAAALAYGLDKQKDGIIAVYDFGGGTFDISILKLHEGIFEVIATGGDTHLGGDDIDNLLIAIALDDIAGDLGTDVRTQPETVQAVRKAVIDAKIALSFNDSARLNVPLPAGPPYTREITRLQFEQLIAPVIARTAAPVRQALKDAALDPAQIDEVVMVGGSTRIPAVRALVTGLFQLEARGKKLHTELNPDEVVALGAAVQAQILAGGSAATEDLLLLDVTPLSLGIEALGGVVAKIIQRNSTIPASATEHFTTGVDGQTNVAIHVVQGERELAKDCRSLARFDLKNIPPMVAGLPRIEVRFLIDANGILKVSAREQRSGQEAEIDVKPTYGLTDEQVETMILDSFDNAEQDISERQLIEAKNEAHTILEAVEKGRKTPAWQQLSFAELENIAAAKNGLEASLKGGDYRIIRQAIERLDKVTRRFAELMMDSAVTGAMKGQTMAAAGESMGQNLGATPSAPHAFAPAEVDVANPLGKLEQDPETPGESQEDPSPGHRNQMEVSSKRTGEPMSSKLFFVAGLTGKVGGAAGRQLLAQGHKLRTLARDPAKAAAWAEQGVDVRPGDWTDAATLAQALEGVDGAYVMMNPVLVPSPGFTEAKALAASLKQALTQAATPRVVALSSFGSEQSSGIGLITSTHLMEQALQGLGVPLALVRAGGFYDNNLASLPGIATTGVFYTFSTPTDRPLLSVGTPDIGAQVASLLSGPAWTGTRIIELGSLLSPDDLAAGMSEALGRPVSAQSIPRERWAATLASFGLPAGQTGQYEEMLDAVNSGWIHPGVAGTEPVPATLTPAEFYKQAAKS